MAKKFVRYVLPSVNSEHGNAYDVLNFTINAMVKCGCTQADVQALQQNAMSGDYWHLREVCQNAIDVCNNIRKQQAMQQNRRF